MTPASSRRSGRARPFLRVPLYFVLVTTVALADGAPHLVVRDAQARPIASVDLQFGPRWYVLWNHSVSGVPVRDFYAFEDGTMLLTDSHTPAFDAGLGHVPGRGRVESDGEHGYWIFDLDEPVPGNAYWLRVGSPRVDHRIVHGNRVISLSELAAGERVRVAVEACAPEAVP